MASRVSGVNDDMINDQVPPRKRPPGLGFVVAMRAREAGAALPGRQEWLVVARWGRDGEYLAISRTDVAVDTVEAPMLLLPKRTVIAVGRRRVRPQPAAFRLAAFIPEGITVGGTFIPASGHALLSSAAANLRLRCKALPLDAGAEAAWSLDAVAVPWIGEFIEQP